MQARLSIGCECCTRVLNHLCNTETNILPAELCWSDVLCLFPGVMLRGCEGAVKKLQRPRVEFGVAYLMLFRGDVLRLARNGETATYLVQQSLNSHLANWQQILGNTKVQGGPRYSRGLLVFTLRLSK